MYTTDYPLHPSTLAFLKDSNDDGFAMLQNRFTYMISNLNPAIVIFLAEKYEHEKNCSKVHFVHLF